jgi:DNA-directed RNA polymerase I subunit RPA1
VVKSVGADETKIIFRQNYLCQGVLDKNQFGAVSKGLVHCVYQLYGQKMAGDLLSTLGRLFTLYMREYGHTCGIDDVVLTHAAERKRSGEINRAAKDGVCVAAKFVLPEDAPDRQKRIEKSGQTAAAGRDDPQLRKALQSKLATNGDNSEKLV